MNPVHATAVARHGPGGWCGVLLRGPSGVGKSDLALRLIDLGWRLVGDDYVDVWRSGDGLYACAAAPIAGLIEARGVGIVSVTIRNSARIGLIVECVQAAVERLPEPGFETVQTVRLPVLTLDVRPASAPQTLTLAMDRL